MRFPLPIQNLIDQFCQLPTVGPKTAERFVFYLLKQNPEKLKNLADNIAGLKNNITYCDKCHSVSTSNPCEICINSKRDQTVLCVVAETKDMLLLEDTKQFNGLYHILGGVINTIDGIGPDTLNIKSLIERIKPQNIKEIILALNPDIEGETTCLFLIKTLKDFNLKITKLARGLPTGANLDYADETTLSNALKYRNQI